MSWSTCRTPRETKTARDLGPPPNDEREKERRKQRLEKLCEREGNNRCCDCGAEGPRWVVLNVGCFICIRCSGIHRSLGTHVSRVRSIELDDWTDDQLNFMERKGNTRTNIILEARIPANTTKPTTSSSFESLQAFIRAKYVDGQYKNPSAAGWKGATIDRDEHFGDSGEELQRPRALLLRPQLSRGSPNEKDDTMTDSTSNSRTSNTDVTDVTDFSDSEEDSDSDDALSSKDNLEAVKEDERTKRQSGDGQARIKSLVSERSKFTTSNVAKAHSHETDASNELWTQLEQHSGMQTDLRKQQIEERKRMLHEGKLKKKEKKKEEKERKKKEKEEKKLMRKTNTPKGKEEYENNKDSSREFTTETHKSAEWQLEEALLKKFEEERKKKRESDTAKVRDRMRAKRIKERREDLCAHCNSFIAC